MTIKPGLGFLGPVTTLSGPYDQPCATENARLAQAVSALGPLRLGDVTIRTEILHLTCPTSRAKARYHLHPFLEVTYVLSGKVNYRTRENAIPVTAGEIFCMPAEVLHGWENDARPSVLLGFLLTVSPASAKPQSLGFRLAEAARNLDFRIRPAPELKFAFEALRAEVRADSPCQQEAIAGYTRLIQALVVRELSAALRLKTVPPNIPEDAQAPRNEQLFLQALAFIEANLAFGISLTDVARHLGVTPRHVSRIFKAKRGVTVGEFVDRRRLEHAQQLLRERPGAVVKDVAAQCGFRDVSYFCRVFRARTGTTPARFGRAKASRKSRTRK
ncbi:MAG: AraC family transcriptional regulator [Planctomycetes bacterium]|nr:AraC family transcriptional regulator [Planctomycetota bacterium]